MSMLPVATEATLMSTVTATGRELVARVLKVVPMFVTLHVAEPSLTDPTATLVNRTGEPGMKVVWGQDGSVLWNGVPLTFTGIAPNSLVSWLAIGLSPSGTDICFYGDVLNTAYSLAGWSEYHIPEKSIKIVVA